MKLTIFGAAGRTGQYLVALALEADHQVTAFARTPDNIIIEDERLTVVQGDVTDAGRVDEAISDSEAVISVLGPASNNRDFAISTGTRHIVEAMNKRGIRRLIISAGAGVEDPDDEPKLFNKVMGFLIRTFSNNVYEDMVQTVEIVRTSGLDWTVVRVPMLTDDPAKGDLKTAYVGKGMGLRITRSDMAAFMLSQLEDDSFIGQAPAISN